jgi:hypothetical protein
MRVWGYKKYLPDLEDYVDSAFERFQIDGDKEEFLRYCEHIFWKQGISRRRAVALVLHFFYDVDEAEIRKKLKVCINPKMDEKLIKPLESLLSSR